MPLIGRNVDVGPPIRTTAFRKVALGTWRSAGDPSVYSVLEYDVTKVLDYLARAQARTGQKMTLTHFVGKAAGHVLAKHPELNCVLRWGQLYPRKSVDIFFQIASDTKGDDLSGTTIRQADQKTLHQIASELQARVKDVRDKGDPAFRKMKNSMKLLPGILSWWVINGLSIIMYTFNLWLPILGSPRDPFGSLMITSIGPLGLDMAYAPLVPYSRCPMLVAVGAVRDRAIVRDGQVVAAPTVQLGVTFDHRLIDGVHAARMAKSLNQIFADPDALLGPA